MIKRICDGCGCDINSAMNIRMIIVDQVSERHKFDLCLDCERKIVAMVSVIGRTNDSGQGTTEQ